MPKCIECGAVFEKHRGKNLYCSKRCSLKYWLKNNREWTREYVRGKSKERNARRRQEYKDNIEVREKIKMQAREYIRKNPLKKFEYSLRKYGLTLNEYEQILESQSNKCPVCEKTFRMKREIHVDHCHKTGKTRGIICESCNMGLGKFYDNIEYLENAIKYLKRFN